MSDYLSDSLGNFLADSGSEDIETSPAAIGSVQDFVSRMRRVLPAGWWPDSAPVLTAVLTGAATAAAWLYSQIQYAFLQTRIATATGFWLDIASQDFYGNEYPRGAGESDSSFSARIRADFFPNLGTRSALITRLTYLNGSAPSIYYAWSPNDNGAYNTNTMAYGTPGYNCGVGFYGSLALNGQTFVYAPPGSGVTAAAVYGSCNAVIPYGTECWVNTTPNAAPSYP